MIAMTINEYWTTKEVSGPKGCIVAPSSYGTVRDAVKQMARRFKHRLLFQGKNELVFDNQIFIQVISFRSVP
jgi:hypothetical protein